MIAEYDGLGNLIAEYVYGNNQRIAKINPDRAIDYYLNDHPAEAGQVPGSARTMVSSSWSANYAEGIPFWDYPFGEIASQTGSAEDTRFDFTGQERDRGTGLLYFGARYLDPGIGRWLSVDPLTESNLSSSNYSFCSNNPINKFDPDGFTDWWAAVKAVGRSGLGIAESVGGILTIIVSLTAEPVTLGFASLGVLGGSALFSYGGTEVGLGILDFKVAIETPEGLKADEYKTIIEIVSENFGADDKTQKALQLIKDLISLTGGAKNIVFNDTFYNFLRATLVANGTANDLMELIIEDNEFENEAEKENNNNNATSNKKTNDQK
ncbi:MAG: tRNA(Glu)-specific nuclease WapA precursor [Syntrophorhabdus sp. PtaB.Bin027]|nr:MAG: tRNA(Glu)-specific nuclease WapA precursor [Syntrophorhabdus sp. PtaB.Bin027]